MAENQDQLHSNIYICILNGYIRYYGHTPLDDNFCNFLKTHKHILTNTYQHWPGAPDFQ